MKKALILTVGTGTGSETDIVKPLVKTIENSNPDFTAFLVSSTSRNNAEMIVEEAGLEKSAYHIEQVPDENDLEVVFKTSNEVIRKLMKRGFPCDKIAVDYTSGTKAMTGGLVLSAVSNNCGELKYITGKRDPNKKIVISGTEKHLSFAPSAIFAYRETQLAQQFIRDYRFSAALELLKTINPALLDEYENRLIENLKFAAKAYQFWDKFDHACFRGEYSKIKFDQPELIDFKISAETKKRIANMINNMKRKVLSEDILADLYNNALRRIEEGKFDDAVARLYRLTEMLAQWDLKNFGISSSDVDLEKVPASLRPELETCRDDRDGKIKIGLKKAYSILVRLGSDLGKNFSEHKNIRGLLEYRNNSILAHGLEPVEEKECRSLMNQLHDLLSSNVPEFKNRVQDLRFPWTGP